MLKLVYSRLPLLWCMVRPSAMPATRRDGSQITHVTHYGK
jgi:hypothetical protein